MRHAASRAQQARPSPSSTSAGFSPPDRARATWEPGTGRAGYGLGGPSLAPPGGRPLDPDVRTQMEARFGHSFGDVRVVDGDEGASAADRLDARAFTLGNSIWFGREEYQPRSESGRWLIAHELAHAVQQRSAPASPPQAKLRLSESDEPAERAADRAADAVAMGENAPGVGTAPAGVIHRQRRRTCSAQAGGTSERTTVRCDDGAEYWVQTVTVSGRVPQTQATVAGGLQDYSTLYFRLRVCRGRDEVIVYTGVDVAPALQTIIENALRGSPLTNGARLEPEARLTWRRSQDFQAEVYGGPVIVGGAPRTGGRGGLRGQIGPFRGQIEIGSDPTLSGPGGQPEIHGSASGGVVLDPVTPVGCYDDTRTVSYRCRPVTYTQRVEEVPADDVQAYVFFEYATDTVIPPTPRFLRGSTDLSGVSFESLARDGYSVRSIDAHTSPEGRRGPPNPRRGERFVGNDRLSEQRRDAALRYLRDHCPQCIQAEPATSAESELYSGSTARGRELEGDPLTERARRGFLGQDPEPADPLRRPEHDRLATLPPDRQRAELYPLLRRAVVHLHRDRVPGRDPEPRPGESADCPRDVQDAMRGTSSS